MADSVRPDPPELLVVSPSFPSPVRAADGQSIYVLEATRALARLVGRPLQVVALRIGDEAEFERGEGFEVERVTPSRPVPDVFALYEPECFPEALLPLARRARARARELAATGAPVVGWCHGYETAAAARALREDGSLVVSVVHYSVADDSLHALAAGRDPERARLLPPAVRAVARWTPPGLRRTLVRGAILGSAAAERLPFPEVVRLQLTKLARERALVAASHRVVAVGRRFSATLAGHHPRFAERIRFCEAGAPPPSPRPAGWAHRPRERRRLLAVGRPTPQKGWDYLARALRDLESREPALADRLELRIVGAQASWRGPNTDFAPGVQRAFRSLCHVRTVDLGRLSASEVRRQYREADLFVLPSVYEPFGLVLLEAMAAGCPILASDADGPADIASAPFATIVPFADARLRAERLRDALRDFATSSAEELEARSEAAVRAAAGYRWEDCAAAHLAYAEEARIEAGGGSAAGRLVEASRGQT